MDPNSLTSDGKWKAFKALGYDVESELGRQQGRQNLISQIRSQLEKIPARRGKPAPFGDRFEVDVPIQGPNGKSAILETFWQFDRGSEVPRLISNWAKVNR